MNQQKALHEELHGEIRQKQVIPDAKKYITLWSEVWDNLVGQSRNAKWIIVMSRMLKC